MLPLKYKYTIKEFVDKNGQSPFAKWFDKLDHIAAAKITMALYRLSLSHIANLKSLGNGIWEYKIDFGPGYRIYFAKDGSELIILLGGGSKKHQSKDIELSKQRWQDYKHRRYH
jgi:putative addiction module killer protein